MISIIQTEVEDAGRNEVTFVDSRGNNYSILLHSQLNTAYFMPKSVKSFFEENIQLFPRFQKTQVRQVCDAVSNFIYPHIKLLNYKDKGEKERDFDQFYNHRGDLKVLRRNNVHVYLLIKSMQWTHLGPIYQAIYWNKYKEIVESTSSVNRSSEDSAIKTFDVTSKN